MHAPDRLKAIDGFLNVNVTEAPTKRQRSENATDMHLTPHSQQWATSYRLDKPKPRYYVLRVGRSNWYFASFQTKRKAVVDRDAS